MTVLVECSACARHIRSNEPTCPFCRASATPFEVTARLAPRPLRLSRAALLIASLAAIEGCGKKPVETIPDAEAVAAPPYGAPPPDLPTTPPLPPLPTSTPPVDAGLRDMPRPPYGMPPRDAGRRNNSKGLPDDPF